MIFTGLEIIVVVIVTIIAIRAIVKRKDMVGKKVI
jgi:hypothetical protein